MKVIVTGGNGFIASSVKEANPQIEWVSVDRKELDLSNPDQVRDYFMNAEYDAVFHTGAMAQTADCENYPELTHRINVESTIEIAKACKAKNARLVFISTEQTFNGKTVAGPFKETDEQASVTVYGNHKIECEEFINANLDNYITLRFSWMMGMSRPGVRVSPNIINNVMKAMFYQEPTKFTVNEIRGMTYAKHLAENFAKILELPSGIYNFSNVNMHNTYESAKIIAKKLGFDDETIDRYILPNHERYADRFRDYRLDNSKIEACGIHLGTFEEDVDECLSDYGWLR
ncbi:MAG: sugar nucleotide-binding protein [Erysipelotrichaceae bacterium]|nr:sugar nucleotide-binding protein [Erysipelotrichaceae bacterium]